MTHIQEAFIENLRFLRMKKGISQLKFSEMIDISPNYLNAVEKGKHFPSPDVLQAISDTLEILPYQLFLEHPAETVSPQGSAVVRELSRIKQRVVREIDELIQKYTDEIP